MGRPRKYRKDLPECVYFKNGAYYYVVNNKWEKLSADYQEAMVRWADLIQLPQCNGTTVGDLLDRYLLEVVPTKAERTQKDNRQEVRFLRAYFGEMAIEDVEPRHCVGYIRSRKALTRANREIALLSHAFNKARLWGITFKPNPASVPGIRNSEKARDRYVTDEEINEFKKDAPTWLKHYVDLKLMLGLRQQDMLSLKWSDVSESHLTVTTLKTQKRLSICLTPELQQILARLNRKSSHLFTTRLGTPYTSSGFNSTWKRVMATYVTHGGVRFNEHDLRGKVATDIDDPVLAKALLGHTKMSMTEQYIKARKTDVVQPNPRRGK